MQNRARVSFDFPFPEERIFRYQAMQDMLHHLANEPLESFTQQELAEMTGADISTVSRSLDLLERVGVIEIEEGRPSRIRIDPDHLDKPNPLLSIPQEEFRRPIDQFLTELRDRLTDSEEVTRIVGVVLFGSVARGEADRGSDIDLLVILDGTHTYCRRVANQAAQSVSDQFFDGDRYEFEILVETPNSATQYGGKLREVFDEGLVLHRSDGFRTVRSAIYEDASHGDE